MAQRVNCVEHAVLADRLSVMRDRATPHRSFRQALYEASAIMAVEVARELPVKEVEIETPLETTRGLRLRDEIAVVPVLRAGLGMVEGFLRLLPDARVGHLGIQRDDEDHAPIDYYERLPPGLPDVPRLRAGPDARHRGQRGPGSASPQAGRSPPPGARVPRRRPGGAGHARGRAPRRHRVDRGDRPRARRERLHPPRASAMPATACSVPTEPPPPGRSSHLSLACDAR